MRKETGRPGGASLSLIGLRRSFAFAMLADYDIMRGKEQMDSDKRKSFSLFRLNIELNGKFQLSDTVRKKIKKKRIQLE